MSAAATPIVVACPKCRSTNVCCDAAARWNVELQAWELAGTQDCKTCEDCGYDSDAFLELPALTLADMDLTDEDAMILGRQHGHQAGHNFQVRHFQPHGKDFDVMAMSCVGDPRGPAYHNAVRAGWGMSEDEFRAFAQEVL